MTASPMGPYENDPFDFGRLRRPSLRAGILGNPLWKIHNQQGGQRMEWAPSTA